MKGSVHTQLALGTVQFGLAYGATNRTGQVPPDEVNKILVRAEQMGVRMVDTAADYGESETVLGQQLRPDHSFEVVTKTLSIRRGVITTTDIDRVLEGVYHSLRVLRLSKLSGLLVHHVEDLLVPGGENLMQALHSLQRRGVVDRVGASVYTPAQANLVATRFQVEIIQMPLNILDQAFVEGGWLKRLKKIGVEVHARSAFMQGILLEACLPKPLLGLTQGFRLFKALCEKNGLSAMTACLAYLQQVSGVDQVVVGVVSVGQFEEILRAWEQAKETKPMDFSACNLSPDPLLNPMNWPAREVLIK